MSEDKIEGVKKVSETSKAQSADQAESLGNEQFQNLMDSHSAIIPSFERVDAKSIQSIEPHLQDVKPIENPEAVTSNKLGSATDQENQKRRQNEGDEIEGVSGVGKTKKPGSAEAAGNESASSTSSSAPVAGTESIDELRNQTKDLVTAIQDVKTQVANAPEIKSSYHKLLKSHINHIDDNLQIASSKLGIEVDSSATTKSDGPGPMKGFLDMLTRSENKMNNLHSALNAAAANGENINPAAMLSLQMKVNAIQREIELFASLLNKALESTKTIMNVQV